MRFAAGLLIVLLGGCGTGGVGQPAIRFSVVPPTIPLGATSEVSWTATGAASCIASGAWSGSRPLGGAEVVSPSAPGTYTYTLSCVNAGVGASVSGVLTVTPPVEQSLTIEGQVIERPIANAAVTVRVGSRSFTGTAGADGRYSIVATVPSTAASAFVSIDALGSSADPSVRFRSLLGSFSALETQAGIDRRLVASENFNVNLNGYSTAESVLIDEQTPDDAALTDATLATARRALDPDELLETATLIRLVLDGTRSLPDEVNSTLDLIDDQATRRAFRFEQTRSFEAVGPYESTRAAVDLDTAQTPGISATELPPALYLTLLGTRTPEYRHIVVAGRSEGYEFNADGTGTYLSTTGSNGLRWTVESNRDLRVRFDPAITFGPFETIFDDPDTGQQVTTVCVNEFVGVRIRRGLGDSAVRTNTNTRTCTDTRFNEIRFDRAGRHWLPASQTEPYLAAEVAGSRFVLTVDGSDVPGTVADESDGVLHEIASFESGGVGSLELTGRSFQWQITSEGTLRVTLANGVESRYRRTYQPFPNAVFGIADHRYPNGRRLLSDQIGYVADNSLIFSPTTLIGTHYLAGVGTDRSSPTGGGGAVLLSPVLKGSAFEFAGDGVVRIRGDALRFDPATGLEINERMFAAGARRTYRIGADGTVIVRFHLRVDAPGSTCEFDDSFNEASFTGCALLEERRLIPIAVSITGRNFWLEQTRNSPVANGISVVASDPYITGARYFDFAPFGDYALPANPP